MRAADVLVTLSARGATIRPVGDRLGVAPARALDGELRDAIRAHRAELLELLRAEAERVAISPMTALDRAWADALARAREGFAASALHPTPEQLRGAAALDLRAAERGRPADRALLAAVYTGRLEARLAESGAVRVFAAGPGPEPEPEAPRHPDGGLPPDLMRCRGCGEPMPVAFGINLFCFACDLGLEHGDDDPAWVRVALELRREQGPAGGRGLRVEAVRRAILRKQRGPRRRTP